MENIHVALVGKTAEPIVEGFRLYPAIDKIYLLHSIETKSIANQIKTRLNRTDSVEVIFRKIEPFNLKDIVEKIIEIGRAEKANNIFVNITGGTNIMAGAACAASFFIGAQAYYVLDRKKTVNQPRNKMLVELPVPKIPFYDTLDPVQREILHILNKKGDICSNSYLREEIRISPQLLSYHIKTLKKQNLIELIQDSTDSRKTLVKIKDSGRLLSQWT